MADPEQARAANKRSLAFAQDGLAAEALTENAQAVTLYRELIASHPDEYDAELAARQSVRPVGGCGQGGGRPGRQH